MSVLPSAVCRHCLVSLTRGLGYANLLIGLVVRVTNGLIQSFVHDYYQLNLVYFTFFLTVHCTSPPEDEHLDVRNKSKTLQLN